MCIKKIVKIMILTIMLAVVVNAALAAPSIPARPTANIYVQDYAKIITPETERQIQSIGKSLANKTKAQLVVVTVPSLEGAAIGDYALALFRSWGIGDKQKNNGVLLLVALKERKSRIEVGYGLEGALPDAKTGRIQDEYMIPYFKQGNYDKGILNAYSVLVNEVANEYKVTIGQAKAAKPKKDIDGVWFFVGLAIVILPILGVIWLIVWVVRRFSKGGTYNNGHDNHHNNHWYNNNDSFGSSSDDSFGGGSSGGGGSDRDW